MSLIVDVRKKFKGFQLNVSFQTQGGRMGILGASGAGKSMTLKMIAGIERPDEGIILLNERVLFDSSKKIDITPQFRKVGYLFQQYALFPNMTVTQNIGCGLQQDSKTEREKKIQEMLVRFQLEDLGNRFPHQLSGGQQQRVALARCLASDPELLLLDEPFSALDAHLREQVTLEMKTFLADFSGDSIMVSHNRDEIFSLCPNLLVMDQGRTLAHGGTKELFHNPRGLGVARLTGCKNISPIERIDGHTLFAKNWNLTLHTETAIDAQITHVGVRAHDLHFADKIAAEDNRFPCNIFEVQEGLFETTLLLDMIPKSKEYLWYKTGKSQQPKNPEKDTMTYFAIPGDKLMLLIDDTKNPLSNHRTNGGLNETN